MLSSRTDAPLPFLILPAAAAVEQATDRVEVRGESQVSLLDLRGPGTLRRIRLEAASLAPSDRSVILRAFWDDEPDPSIEVPLALLLAPTGAAQLDLPMPFQSRARLELASQAEICVPVWFSLTWETYEPSGDAPLSRLHAQWRRESPTENAGEDYTILDATGRGWLVECLTLGDRAQLGGATTYVDGEAEPRCLREWDADTTFGYRDSADRHHRYAPLPPIPFQRSLHLRVGCLSTTLASLVVWYQHEPHRRFYRLPPPAYRDDAMPAPLGKFDVAPPCIGTWWLCGPFDNSDGRAMRSTLPMERDFEPADTYPTWLPESGSPWSGRSETSWVRRRDFHGFIDFHHLFRPPTAHCRGDWPVTAVAASTIQLRANSRATLHIAWDDELVLRVNDTHVFGPESQSVFRRREIPVSLRSGQNRILLKLSNSRNRSAGNWAFSFRAVLPDGTEVGTIAVP